MSKQKKAILIVLVIVGIAVMIAGIFCFKGIIHKNSVGELNFIYTDQYNYEYFSADVSEFVKDSDKIISESELKKAIYKGCKDIIELSNEKSKYEIDPTVYVYHNKEKGIFIVNLGVYHTFGFLNTYDRESKLYIDADSGEILKTEHSGPNDYPLCFTKDYEQMTNLVIDDETKKLLNKYKGKYKEAEVSFIIDKEYSDFQKGRGVIISETGFTFNGSEYFGKSSSEYSLAKFDNISRLSYDEVKELFNGNKKVTVISATNSTDQRVNLIICGEDIYIWNNGEIIKLEKE